MTFLYALICTLISLFLIWAFILSRSEVKCPICKGPGMKTIWYGMVFYLCKDSEKCACAWGFGEQISYFLKYWDGIHFCYEGSYMQGLWWWLTDSAGEEEL